MCTNLKVNGFTLKFSESPYAKPKQLSRKIFNAQVFEPKAYKHEIANHYRDYKNLKIRKKRKSVIYSRRVFEDPYEYRDPIKINSQMLPRFDQFFPLQRKHPTRTNIPADTCYNDTIIRIHTAKTIKELSYLAHRQEQLLFSKCKNKNKSYNEKDVNLKNNNPLRDVKTSISVLRQADLQLNPIVNYERKQQQTGHFDLGYIPSAVEERQETESISNCNSYRFLNHKVKKNIIRSGKLQSSVNQKSIEYWIQFASNFYREEFESHLEYLESIGQRIAKNNRKNLQTSTSNKHLLFANSIHSDSESDNSTRTRLLQFAEPLSSQKTHLDSEHSNINESISNDCQIRVDITRSVTAGVSSQRLPLIGDQSMNNIFQYHDSTICSKTIPVNNESSSGKASNQINDLTNTLNQLEISEQGILPRIVLTDFSVLTDSLPIESYTYTTSSSTSNTS